MIMIMEQSLFGYRHNIFLVKFSKNMVSIKWNKAP